MVPTDGGFKVGSTTALEQTVMILSSADGCLVAVNLSHLSFAERIRGALIHMAEFCNFCHFDDLLSTGLSGMQFPRGCAYNPIMLSLV